jgi:hypothetical protein
VKLPLLVASALAVDPALIGARVDLTLDQWQPICWRATTALPDAVRETGRQRKNENPLTEAGNTKHDISNSP